MHFININDLNEHLQFKKYRDGPVTKQMCAAVLGKGKLLNELFGLEISPEVEHLPCGQTK